MASVSFRGFYSVCIVMTVLCCLYLLRYSPNTYTGRSTIKAECPQVNLNGNNKYGYIMATHYSDQMTGSIANVISLQCYASKLDPRIRVVEPFVRHSMFGVNLYAASNLSTPYYDDNSVTRSDILDKSKWDDFTTRRNFPPLIGWKDFLKDAPHKLILVNKVTTYVEVKAVDFFQSAAMFAEKYDFEIVRNISVPQKIMYPEVEFKMLMYGDYDPHDVTVIINLWGGPEAINDNFRMGISGYNVRKCKRGQFYANIPLSSSIINDAIKYNNNFLHNKGYISVMVRMEYFLINHNRFKGKTKDQISDVVMQCFNSLLSEIKAKKVDVGVDSIFLTMDTRKSGSKGFKLKSDTAHAVVANATSALFSMLYGNSSTLEEWDRSFETVASHTTPGYIAMLQKHLAAKGVCLLTVGGGSFQSTARQLHSQYHPRGPKCAYQVPKC